MVARRLDFHVQGRRRKFIKAAVERELETVKATFLTKGQTGRVLFEMMSYGLCNRRAHIQRETLDAVLIAVETWLCECTPGADEDLRQCLYAACDRARHVGFWAEKFLKSRTISVRDFATSTQRIAASALVVLEGELRKMPLEVEAAPVTETVPFVQPDLFSGLEAPP